MINWLAYISSILKLEREVNRQEYCSLYVIDFQKQEFISSITYLRQKKLCYY
jgi:hypothetical protein